MIFTICFIIGLIALLLMIAKNKEEKQNRYRSKKVMTPTEHDFYHRLTEALPEHIILAQVQLSRILEVQHGPHYYQDYNPISQLSLDYLVCSKKDSSVLAAIELDDSSHNREKQRKRDEKKNQALAEAGIKLIRWHVTKKPTEKDIRNELALPLNPKSNTAHATWRSPITSLPSNSSQLTASREP